VRLGPLALSRSAVDRAAHRRQDDAWLAAAWSAPDTRVLVVSDGQALVRYADPPALVLGPTAAAPAGERYLLGEDAAGRAYFAVAVDVPPELPAGTDVRAAGLREVGAALDDRDAGLLVHAVALERWHSAHRHCARCGEPTVVAAAGHLRRCPADGSEHFPRTDPAVIMLVVDEDDRCLLGHQARWPARRFSTLAGFVEPGESAERAVVREVREETGVLVTHVRYQGSQPWPFPSSLMLGFTARATSTEIRVDGEEIAEARWFRRAELAADASAGRVLLPPPVSIARRLIEGWYGAALPQSPPAG